MIIWYFLGKFFFSIFDICIFLTRNSMFHFILLHSLQFTFSLHSLQLQVAPNLIADNESETHFSISGYLTIFDKSINLMIYIKMQKKYFSLTFLWVIILILRSFARGLGDWGFYAMSWLFLIVRPSERSLYRLLNPFFCLEIDCSYKCSIWITFMAWILFFPLSWLFISSFVAIFLVSSSLLPFD